MTKVFNSIFTIRKSLESRGKTTHLVSNYYDML
jgi:hypothetical protein